MSEQKLPAPKFCPFCGAFTKQLRQDYRTGRFYVRCAECLVNGPLADTLTGAVEAWNTRAPDPSSADNRRSWLRRGIGARPNEG